MNELTLNDYQHGALVTDRSATNGIPYYALGVAGEAGEVAEKVKKVLRDQNGLFNYDSNEAIKYELGDVMWYVSVLAHKLGYTLEEVAVANLTKLHDRKERDVLKGSGDDR